MPVSSPTSPRMTAYENDPLIGTGTPFPVTATCSLKLMTRSCREPASPPFLPATPFVSAFVQGTFVPSAIAASVRGTLLPPSGTFACASA